jgi:hypothetical protein
MVILPFDLFLGVFLSLAFGVQALPWCGCINKVSRDSDRKA